MKKEIRNRIKQLELQIEADNDLMNLLSDEIHCSEDVEEAGKIVVTMLIIGTRKNKKYEELFELYQR